MFFDRSSVTRAQRDMVSSPLTFGANIDDYIRLPTSASVPSAKSVESGAIWLTAK
jgi:hypothetical protein